MDSVLGEGVLSHSPGGSHLGGRGLEPLLIQLSYLTRHLHIPDEPVQPVQPVLHRVRAAVHPIHVDPVQAPVPVVAEIQVVVVVELEDKTYLDRRIS